LSTDSEYLFAEPSLSFFSLKVHMFRSFLLSNFRAASNVSGTEIEFAMSINTRQTSIQFSGAEVPSQESKTSRRLLKD
jgi:hypothetical protein